MRRRALLIASCVVCIGACGSQPLSGKPVSKASFLARASAICRVADAKLSKLEVPPDPESVTKADLPKWVSFFEKERPIITQEVHKLDALPPPDQGAPDVRDLLGSFNDTLRSFDDTESAAKAGDLATFREDAVTLARTSDGANLGLSDYGLPGCVV